MPSGKRVHTLANPHIMGGVVTDSVAQPKRFVRHILLSQRDRYGSALCGGIPTGFGLGLRCQGSTQEYCEDQADAWLRRMSSADSSAKKTGFCAFGHIIPPYAKTEIIVAVRRTVGKFRRMDTPVVEVALCAAQAGCG